MACPVLIAPACLVAGKVAGAVAGTAASGALNGIAAAIESGITWMVTQTATWWVQVPSPDLAGEPAVGQLQQWMLPLAVAVAVLGLIIAGGKMALTRRANPLIDVGSGLAVIAATSAVGVLLPSLLLKAGDAWSTLGAPGIHRGPVHPAAGQRADPGRVDPGGGRGARHRRHHHLRHPGGAHAVPAGRPGGPGRGAAAGRRRDADPGHPRLVPPRHRLDARADLLQAGRGGGVRDRVHHDRHRQGPAHRADGLRDGVPVPAGAAGPDAVLHLDHRARRGRLRRRRLPPDRAPGSRGRRRAARDVRRSGRLRPGRAGPHGQRPGSAPPTPARPGRRRPAPEAGQAPRPHPAAARPRPPRARRQAPPQQPPPPGQARLPAPQPPARAPGPPQPQRRRRPGRHRRRRARGRRGQRPPQGNRGHAAARHPRRRPA